MTLQSRLADLITAIGTDIKALQAAAGGTPSQFNVLLTNQATSGSADTYLVGSSINIPQGKIKVGTIYKCKFNAVKTNAGVAAPVATIRVGTAGSTADSSRAALTFAAQTAVVDEGVIEIEVTAQAAGASTVFQAVGSLGHRLTTTGLSTSVTSVAINKGAPFDSTGAGLKIGVSINPGASGVWTISFVSAELKNLT